MAAAAMAAQAALRVSNIKLSLLKTDVAGGRRGDVPQVACQGISTGFALLSLKICTAMTQISAAHISMWREFAHA
jgi:hypothetical protein